MPPRLLNAVQIGLGIVAAVALVAYVWLTAASDPVAWVIVGFFVVVLGFDAALHIRALRKGAA